MSGPDGRALPGTGPVREFVFGRDHRFAECHAPTLAALPDGDVLVAWFGGSREGAPDVGIWLARRTGGEWTAPVRLAGGDGLPHWNPVLFPAPDGVLHLYYKVGPSPSAWWTREMLSRDGGRTWTGPRDLVPGGIGGRGPVKNKPIVLAGGEWLAPASVEGEHWDAFVDISEDGGRTWRAGARVPLDHATFAGKGVIQPALWASSPRTVHMLLRSTCGRICRSDSDDRGESWRLVYATDLPSNNSGIDLAAVGGTLVLAYNPVAENWGPRTPLVVDLSRDDGATWDRLAMLEDEEGEFSYPAVIPLGDGVAIAYTWRRERITYATIPDIAGT